MKPDREAEHILDECNLPFEYVKDLPLAQIDEAASLQNQARPIQAIDVDIVNRYTSALARKDVFPAIVVYPIGEKRYVIMGGNHRVAAARKAGRTTWDAYVVEPKSRAQIERATWLLNYALGKAPSQDEAIAHSVLLVQEHGFSLKGAAKRMGVSPSTIDHAIRRQALQRRLARLDLPTKVTTAIEAANMAQSETIFRALVLHGTANEWNTQRMREVRDAAIRAASEAEGVAFIEQMALQEQDAQRVRMQRRRRSKTGYQHLRMHLGALVKVITMPVTSLDITPEQLHAELETARRVTRWLEGGLVAPRRKVQDGAASQPSPA